VGSDEWIFGLARGVGHTEAAIKSGATVVVAHEHAANDVRRRGGKAITLADARRGRTLARREPLAIDPEAVKAMLSNLHQRVIVLEAERDAKQPCGHPVACIEGETTMHCSMCAVIAERDAALARLKAYESPRPLTGPKKGELHRRADQGDWVAKEVIALRERVRELTEWRPMEPETK